MYDQFDDRHDVNSEFWDEFCEICFKDATSDSKMIRMKNTSIDIKILIS